MCLFENCIAIVLVMPGKPSFKPLEFNVTLQYSKSPFSEEMLRCQPIIKHLNVNFKVLRIHFTLRIVAGL